MDGPATVAISGDSVRAQLRDAADTTRIRLSFEGTLRGDSALVLVQDIRKATILEQHAD
jgi:hypothetical protein